MTVIPATTGATTLVLSDGTTAILSIPAAAHQSIRSTLHPQPWGHSQHGCAGFKIVPGLPWRRWFRARFRHSDNSLSSLALARLFLLSTVLAASRWEVFSALPIKREGSVSWLHRASLWGSLVLVSGRPPFFQDCVLGLWHSRRCRRGGGGAKPFPSLFVEEYCMKKRCLSCASTFDLSGFGETPEILLQNLPKQRKRGVVRSRDRRGVNPLKTRGAKTGFEGDWVEDLSPGIVGIEVRIVGS